MKEIAICLAVLVLAAFGLWSWFAGPCWMYTFSAANEIPGRCLMIND